MSSGNNFDDEPSMAEILASVRRIVSDDKTPYLSMDDEPEINTEEPPTKVHANLAEDESEPETQAETDSPNRSDILQRLLRKQADLEDTNQASPTPTLSANPSSALSFQPITTDKSKRAEPKLDKVDTPELAEDEIQILDLSNPVRPSAQPEHKTDPEAKPEPIDLEQAIQNWAEGAGKPLLKKMIREEISDLFKSTFKD